VLSRRLFVTASSGALAAAPAKPASAAEHHHRIWERWIALWNGDLAVGEQILAERLTVHSPKLSDALDPSTINSRDAALALIGGVQAIAQLHYDTQVGPIAEGKLVTGGWTFAGTYRGGLPGATAAPGTALSNRGIDVLRLEGGQIVEWWSAAENLAMLVTLGLIHAG
jgi:hypothetical protein